jgi:hypothetical protein
MAEESNTTSSTPQSAEEVSAVASMLSELSKFEPSVRERIIQTLATFFGISSRDLTWRSRQEPRPSIGTPSSDPAAFSEDRSISPKQFMLEKQARTDVEKVACLSYYLTHYRNTGHFKTLDISKLNTEAAQIKFSNPAVAVENAVKMGYVIPTTRGNKQLSAIGELFVQALPDREKAKEIMANARPRRRARRTESEQPEEEET